MAVFGLADSGEGESCLDGQVWYRFPLTVIPLPSLIPIIVLSLLFRYLSSYLFLVRPMISLPTLLSAQ